MARRSFHTEISSFWNHVVGANPDTTQLELHGRLGSRQWREQKDQIEGRYTNAEMNVLYVNGPDVAFLALPIGIVDLRRYLDEVDSRFKIHPLGRVTYGTAMYAPREPHENLVRELSGWHASRH